MIFYICDPNPIKILASSLMYYIKIMNFKFAKTNLHTTSKLQSKPKKNCKLKDTHTVRTKTKSCTTGVQNKIRKKTF